MYRKKIGLNFLLRNDFDLPFYDLEQSPYDYEAVSRNLPPIIFCARFELTWFRKSPLGSIEGHLGQQNNKMANFERQMVNMNKVYNKSVV